MSLSGAKPMGIFGPEWQDHPEKISESWDSLVADSDTVIVAGDISWAMRLGEAAPDLRFLAERPGRKVLVRGNHDYWWKRENTNKIQATLHPSITLLCGTSVVLNEVGITGTRGWRPEEAADLDQAANRRILERELRYLRAGLDSLPSGLSSKIVALHYPPFGEDQQPNEFFEVLAEHSVDILVYGHIHGAGVAPEGNVRGVECHLVAVDHTDFSPKLILPCV